MSSERLKSSSMLSTSTGTTPLETGLSNVSSTETELSNTSYIATGLATMSSESTEISLLNTSSTGTSLQVPDLWSNKSSVFPTPVLFANVTEDNDEPVLEDEFAILFSMVVLCINFITILGNSLVIAAFIREPRVRVPRNLYILNLALTDLCTALFAVPLYTVSVFNGGVWPLGRIACSIWQSLNLMARLETSFTIFLITYDRYCMVRDPINYRTKTGQKRRALILILVSWIVTFLMRVPFIIFSHWYAMTKNKEILCSPHSHFDAPFRIGLPVYDMTYTIVSACIEFFIPLVFILYWNIQVYRKIKQQSNKVADGLIVATVHTQAQEDNDTMLDAGTDNKEHTPEPSRENDDKFDENLGDISSTRIILEHSERRQHERRSSYAAVTHNVTLDVHVSHALGTVILLDSVPHNHPYFHSTIATTTAKCKIQLKRTIADLNGSHSPRPSCQAKGKSRQNSSKGKSKNSSKGKRPKYTEKYSVESLEMSSGFSKASLGRKLNPEDLSHEMSANATSDLNDLDNDIESVIMGVSPSLRLHEDDDKKKEGNVKKDNDDETGKSKQKERNMNKSPTIQQLQAEIADCNVEDSDISDNKLKESGKVMETSPKIHQLQAEIADPEPSHDPLQQLNCDSMSSTAPAQGSDQNTTKTQACDTMQDEVHVKQEGDAKGTESKKQQCIQDNKDDVTESQDQSQGEHQHEQTDAQQNTQSLTETLDKQMTAASSDTSHADNMEAKTTDSSTPQQRQHPLRRQQRRAALILAVVTGVFVVCRTPYVAGRLAAVACGAEECIHDAAYQAMFWLGWSLALINPFLYAFISTAFREYCIGVFKKSKEKCCCCCKSIYS